MSTVRGVEAALERLQPVALCVRLRNLTMRRRSARHLIARERLAIFGRAHVRPDETAAFPGGIALDRDLRLEKRIGRLRRHIDARAVTIEFPTVIDAA